MNNYPEFAKVGKHNYKINTDFRIAIKCNEIAKDSTIGDFERALAIIFVLFGKEALINQGDWRELLEIAQKYLSCGKKIEDDGKEPDMDYVQDMDYIEASFMSDYNIDLSNIKMHWWKFSNLINGLSNSELGNCCVLNRVRNLRNIDLKEIKDPKEQKKVKKAKEQVSLHERGKKRFSKEEIKNMKDFKELMNF